MRRTHYPPALNRVPAHLTLFRQLPPSVEAELNGRLAALARMAPPRAEIAGIFDLGEGTALRVESEALEEIREELASALHGLLIPQDMAPWRPHITIQNKVDPREARRLQQRLGADFRPRPLAIRGLGTRRYVDGPWEPIRDFVFRGQARE
jgi:2'-5' RNA ligase